MGSRDCRAGARYRILGGAVELRKRWLGLVSLELDDAQRDASVERSSVSLRRDPTHGVKTSRGLVRFFSSRVGIPIRGNVNYTHSHGRGEPTSGLCFRSTIMVVGQQGYPSTKRERDLLYLLTIINNQIIIILILQLIIQSSKSGNSNPPTPQDTHKKPSARSLRTLLPAQISLTRLHLRRKPPIRILRLEALLLRSTTSLEVVEFVNHYAGDHECQFEVVVPDLGKEIVEEGQVVHEDVGI